MLEDLPYHTHYLTISFFIFLMSNMRNIRRGNYHNKAIFQNHIKDLMIYIFEEYHIELIIQVSLLHNYL